MKALLYVAALGTCTCLSPGAAARSAFQDTPLPTRQQTSAPPPAATQAPAPIVRPRALILKPAPGLPGIQSTAAPAPIATPRPKAVTTPASPTSTPHNVPAPTPTTRPLAPGTTSLPFNRTTVVIDASHGGIDGGSRITDTLQEKDVDLAFAFKLRSLLVARGFTVVLTREADAASPSDSATPLTLDDRAGTANHLHPVACLLVHATGSGKGVHLYSSDLAPIAQQPAVVPWLTAQASWVTASRALQHELGTALTRAEVPLVLSRASIRPLDSLTCPALVLELAPTSSNKESVNDGSYHQRIANALASALVFWQNQAQPPGRELPIPTAPTAPVASTAPSRTGGQP